MLLAAAYVAQFLATLAGVALARRREDYRPIAFAFSAQLATSWLRAGLVAFVLAPARARMVAARIDPVLTPFTGTVELVAVAVDGAARLLGPAILSAVACAVFLERPRRALVPVGLVWAIASIALFAGYPSTRGPSLARAYLASDAAGLAVAIGVSIHWIWRIERPRAPHIATWLCGAAVGSSLATVYRSGDVFRRWADLAAIVFVMIYGLVAALEVWWWNRSSFSKSS